MITELSYFDGTGHDPYHNLAVEQYLLENVREGQCILYLWQNENTVVIGKNQNPWQECKTALLNEEGGKLARRLSGGGAVFHDLGNLNFTFIVPQAEYDLDKQLDVILTAVRALGVPAAKSGRNDILAGGRKFSGNAFYKNGRQAYHHGTLLVSADLTKMSRYLSPSKLKLQAKGVESVRSRVANLTEFVPGLTIDGLKAAMIQAFSAVYGLPVETLGDACLDERRIAELSGRNRSWEWNYGQRLPFTCSCEDRFPWGSVQIQLRVEHGIIREAKVYSDAMDWTIAPKMEKKLKDCRFERSELKKRLGDCVTPEERAVLNMLCNESVL